ncbi:MAG TPA: D-sedoheptulose 7-phosphate isomerase [Acidobacteriaceae bacterium]|jgi:D-sedoheptulose 7-phosphate isomerase|nr:D-sedoheptulose 7-phosphate isomerase [Acidobacteriaceae bacterium]
MPSSPTEIVRDQLQQSIHTFTTVLHDETIHNAVVEAARVTANSLKSGGKLLVCGNGGSAADAQHLVAEFVCRLVANRPALPAIALTTDTSILTAVSNDFTFERIFSRQVEALGKQGDILLAITTSGNSPNCLHAVTQAKQLGLTTVSLTGNGGGKIKSLADINIVVPTTVTSHIQECHLALEHIFCMLVERLCFGEDLPATP